jgi:hypothetical protein
MKTCIDLSKTYKSVGITCIWNDKTIYLKKAPKIQKIIPVEVRDFNGYVNSRFVIQTAKTIREKATETCNAMMQANPTAEITCRWGDEYLAESQL